MSMMLLDAILHLPFKIRTKKSIFSNGKFKTVAKKSRFQMVKDGCQKNISDIVRFSIVIYKLAYSPLFKIQKHLGFRSPRLMVFKIQNIWLPLLTGWFARKNLRRHSGIYNVYYY